jgi:hypothetical protein
MNSALELSYYETRLTYDMSRECYPDENYNIRNIDSNSREMSKAVSSKISQLFFDVSNLFENDIESIEEISNTNSSSNCSSNGNSKSSDLVNNGSNFDILLFTENLLGKSIRVVVRVRVSVSVSVSIMGLRLHLS